MEKIEAKVRQKSDSEAVNRKKRAEKEFANQDDSSSTVMADKSVGKLLRHGTHMWRFSGMHVDCFVFFSLDT